MTMNQLTPVQVHPTMITPNIILQIFTQLQALQSNDNAVRIHCNATKAELNKKIEKCHREHARWREVEQELTDENHSLHLEVHRVREKNLDMEILQQQHKHQIDLIAPEIKNLKETLQKTQNDLELTLEELKKYKSNAIYTEEETRKANVYAQNMEHQLNISKGHLELCHILANKIIESEENDNINRTVIENSTLFKFSQALEELQKLKNLKNEMNITSNDLMITRNEKNELKKVIQEKETILFRITEEKNVISQVVETQQEQITILSKEKQQLLLDLEAEKKSSSMLQRYLAEQKENCIVSMVEIQAILNGRSQEEAILDAATRGAVEEIEVLLKIGANIEATDDMKRTPLILAAMKGQLEACKLLLEKGANLEARATGWYNNTPFLAAVIYSKRLDVVKFLASAGANMQAKDTLGTTAFQKDAIDKTIMQWLKTQRS